MQHQIKKEKPISKAWLIWGMAAVFYLYEYILRASPGVMTEQLMEDWAITSTSLGVLSSMYYYSYTALQIPCGLIVDRFGARLIITISCALCVIGTFIFSEAESLFMAQIGRFVIGAGSACAFLSALKLISDWFPPRYFAIVSGLTTLLGISIGGILVGKPFALFVNFFGWRPAMLWYGLLGIFVTIICWKLIENHPKAGASQATTEISTSTLLKDLGILMKSRQTWLVSIYGCLFYVTISVFSELWAVPYIMKKYTLNNADAASISAFLLAGKGVGAPGIALLSHYLKSRRKVMFMGTFGATFAFMMSIYLTIPIWMVQGLLFVTGVCVGAQVLCFAVNQEINPHEMSATTVGFTNTVVMISGVIFQPVLGALLDCAWDGQVAANGTCIYSLDAYQMAMISLITCLFISWILVFFIKETYPQEN